MCINKNVTDILLSSFLFDKIPIQDAERIINTLDIKEKAYAKGDVIFSPNNFERKIGFVVNGECYISRPTSGQQTPINIVKSGDPFGITTVFSDNVHFSTLITAKTVCSVFFIKSEDLLRIMDSYHTVALNTIRFLTHRIEFLNERITTFSSSSVEDKLVSYILSLCKRTGKTEFSFNKKQSADAISCGRASLYRAMESISATGYVKFDSKKIYINDLNGLERMLK